MIPVEAYLVVSTLLFFIAVNINFVVFNRFLYPDHLEGYMYSLFVIVVAAAETAIAISIIINVYRKLNNIRVDSINELKN